MYGYFPRYYWQLSIYTLMAEPLFDAIYNRYVGTALADNITDLYMTYADDEAVYPYGTFSLASNVPEWTFDDNFENCIIQFTLFSKGINDTADEVLDAAVALKAAFDFFDLVVVGYTTISLTRMVANLIRIEGVWQYNVSYRILIQND